MNSSNFLGSSTKNTDLRDQMELSVNLNSSPKSETSTVIYDLLILQDEKMDKQQLYLTNLSQGILEVLTVLSQDNNLDASSADVIEALKQEVTLLGKGMIKIYQHLEKDNTGKELKSGQQTLQKAITSLASSTIETNPKKSTNNISYLDWKQVAVVIAATSVISSICSFTIFQVTSNWKTDTPQTPIEKPLKTKTKKISK
jgi:hypothetical protein